MTTSYFYGLSGETHYIKPLPIVSSPWGSDDVAATEEGTTGWFSVTTDDSTEYSIYQQLGGSPASSDTVIGIIPSLQEATLGGSVADDLHLAANAIAGRNIVNSIGGGYYSIEIRDPEDNLLRTLQFNPTTGDKDLYTS